MQFFIVTQTFFTLAIVGACAAAAAALLLDASKVRTTVLEGAAAFGALLVLIVILSLGTRPKLAGTVFGIGPWSAVAWAPVIESALPARLTVFVSLLAGLLVAVALADEPSRWRWLLAVAGVLLTLPHLGLAQWSSPVPRPTFFAMNRDERILPMARPHSSCLTGPRGGRCSGRRRIASGSA